ncbi:hypothetical protein PoB_003763400 [Plakobranchus ocellatus]|uniref:Uncharacterized protein n=1 Tax=Plakobranchus ocellatus TaxID=259542 RepID=A0AAV4AYC2_9GAST|nr:hypothetical protein PoB_003763400 [Plakobranchus ocellatus]
MRREISREFGYGFSHKNVERMRSEDRLANAQADTARQNPFKNLASPEDMNEHPCTLGLLRHRAKHRCPTLQGSRYQHISSGNRYCYPPFHQHTWLSARYHNS